MTISLDAARPAARIDPAQEPAIAARPVAPDLPDRSDYGQRGGHASETKGPAQLPQVVAKTFEAAPKSPEQERFERLLRTDTKLFVNPTRSPVNCCRCAIALDQRFGGDMTAVARDEAIRGHDLGPIGGMLAELARPEVIERLVDADDPVRELVALREGIITLSDLREVARPKIERAIEALLGTDFAGDTSAAETAVEAVRADPFVVLMGRHNVEDYSIDEVARRLDHPLDAVESFASKATALWSSLPLFEVPEFDTKKLIRVARDGGVGQDLLKRIKGMKTNQRAVLSFLSVAADGTVHSHLLNVVKPNTERPLPGGGSLTMGPSEFVVDGQLGHVYHAELFTRFIYPNLLSAQLLITGDEVHDGRNNALYRTLLNGVAETDEILRWANR